MDAGAVQRRDDEWADERQLVLELSLQAGRRHSEDSAAQERIAAVLDRPRNWLTVKEFCERAELAPPDA